MEDETMILSTTPKPPTPASCRHACLVLIYPTGPTMGTRYALGDKQMVIGRDESCEIAVSDESVSRHHACIQPSPEGYGIVDLQSTNGTYVNDQRLAQTLLHDGDYVRIGSGIFRFLASNNLESAYHEEIYRLAIIDALTEIHNKRYFLEFLSRELACSARYRRPLALILFDIDRFKAINDLHGHLCGDYSLRELASWIKKRVVRKEDLFARYGGEEFALVLPETTLEGARVLAERLRRSVEACAFQYEGQSFRVTISLGVAAATGEQWLTTNEIIEQADSQLYLAKRQGRDRVLG